MELTGGSDRDVDRVVWVDDLSVATLVSLIDRLRETKGAQFFFREAEMDDAYRQADADCRLAVHAGSERETVSQLERVRQLIFDAHDLVGLEKIPEAVQELNKVIDIKIGLGESAR
ncbi:MAG: hypothetical protein GEU75_08220 [Dehalococcoidia bacterium]|nr:hypothetical protein [Dehalococcoidia bacterium]